MKFHFPTRLFSIAVGSLLLSHALVAQTTTVQLFSAVNERGSDPTASYNTPATFSSSTLNLTCSAAAIIATLSGPQPSGNLLIDNNVFVTVTPAAGPAGQPQNICVGGVNIGGTYGQNCFTPNYENNYATFVGQDPDTFLFSGQTVDAYGGVPPIDISSYLVSGKQSVNIALEDEGGVLASSTIFLTTNCTQNGVTGPATVSGNPTTTDLNQSFNFDTGNGQQIGLVYNLTQSNQDNNNLPGATPQVTDLPLSATTFQADLVGTSFATSNCLIHTGELLSDGVTPACKLYTLACTNTNSSAEKGANCPVSAYVDEVIQDVFDGPPFSLQSIYTPNGIFRQGIGLLMASDTWPSPVGPCEFDATAGPVANLPCPQNLLDSFSGPGGFSGSGLTTNPNSTFVSIYGVPQDLTTVWVNGEWPDNWVNTSTQKVNFFTQAPNLSNGASTWNGSKFVTLRGAGNYIPAPIKSVSYGVSAPNAVPLPVNEGTLSDTDTVINNSAVNCTTGYLPPSFTNKTVPNFSATQTLNLADGQYVLHYFAEDCAGTQELKFTEAPVTLSWSTNFFTYPINVDTRAPSISNLALSAAGPFKVNQTVYATYTCTDTDSSGNPNTGAGLVLCGTSLFAPQSIWTTNGKTRIDTSSSGLNKSFVVYAADGAGNTHSATITYTVTK